MPKEKPEYCRSCPMYNMTGVAYSMGSKNEVMVVGQSPGKNELIEGRPFVGDSGILLTDMFTLFGIDRSEFFTANSIRCFEDKRILTTKDISTALVRCRDFLVRGIAATRPKLIIGLGDYALKTLLGKAKITKHRGQFYYSDEFGCPIYMTTHPAYVLRERTKDYPHKKFQDMNPKEKSFYLDIKQVSEYINNGYKEVTLMDRATGYRAGTLRDLKRLAKAEEIGLDLETYSRRDNTLLSIGFSDKPGEAVAFMMNEDSKYVAGVNAILTSPQKKILAARPFDENTLIANGLAPMNGILHDVLPAANLVDENYHRFNLENVAFLYAGMRNIKDLSEGLRENLVDADIETVIRYQCVDADATISSWQGIKKRLHEDERLLNYYIHFTMPIMDLIRDISRNGCPIDRAKLHDNIDETELELRRLSSEAIKLIPRKIKDMEKHKGNLKLSRPALIADTLFSGYGLKPSDEFRSKKTHEPSTCAEQLKMFSKNKFALTVLEFKKLYKILTSYLLTLPSFIHPDGCVYPTTSISRTVTGRSVMLEPAAQTFPARGKYARLFKEVVWAGEGWLLGSRDLSQSELRIMGWLADDKNILDALKKGIDLHTKTAARHNKIEIALVDEMMRFRAKGINFGLVYGMSPKGLRAYLRDEYDIHISEHEAEEAHRMFFGEPDGYYGLPIFYKKITKGVQDEGYTRSVLGRKRRLPTIWADDQGVRNEAIRQAINFQGQSPSSDFGLIAMKLFNDKIKKEKKLVDRVKPLWFIHDNVLFRSRKPEMKPAMAILKHCMEEEIYTYVKKNFGVTIGYPVKSDGKIGEVWSAMSKVE